MSENVVARIDDMFKEYLIHSIKSTLGITTIIKREFWSNRVIKIKLGKLSNFPNKT